MSFINKKGSVTVEASIVLPIFICAVLSIAFFIKLIFVHEIIQHAITQTADEIAAYSYLYHISGIKGIQDETEGKLQNKASLLKEHLSSLLDIYNSPTSIKDIVDEISKNPAGEIAGMVYMLAEDSYKDIKKELCIPVVKYCMGKYMTDSEWTDADKRLENLHIINGMNGLDFSSSSFFEDEEGNIDIIVKYDISIPVPIKFLPQIQIVQRASAKAWLGGDEPENSSDASRKDGIWNLDNFKRGNTIRSLFGANLPSQFPVLSAFDYQTGTATVIKSMDLTDKSYKNGEGVMEKLDEYIGRLAQYRGQENPYRKNGIVIKENQIKERCLILVIPENDIAPEIQTALDMCVSIAAVREVKLEIKRYGYKNL